MDEVAQYNVERWRALVEANAVFTRPALHLDAASAREMVDPEGRLGDLGGKQVLCLAGGGGRQSAAFALLGARVTVVDLSEAQLQRDREAAAHYGVQIDTVQGDMRDLSRFDDAAFDVVWQPYALNFVPNAHPVFREVARVLRPRGVYHVQCANPFVFGLGTQDWNGDGYLLKHPYVDGAELTHEDEPWVYSRGERQGGPIARPREYRHTLSTLLNGLVERGFVLLHVADDQDMAPDPDAEPGTWQHFTAVAPPWLAFWASYRPDVLAPADSS